MSSKMVQPTATCLCINCCWIRLKKVATAGSPMPGHFRAAVGMFVHGSAERRWDPMGYDDDDDDDDDDAVFDKICKALRD